METWSEPSIIARIMYRALTVPLGVLLLAGCTQSADSPELGPATTPAGLPSPPPRVGTAADFGGGEFKTAVAYLEEPRFAAADLMRGELLSLACQACHTLDAGQAHLLGPNLYGVFGRISAGQDDFDYSPELRSAKLVWTPAALEAWLANPADFLPGNNMVFAGYNSATDRRDLIAFLLHNSGGLVQ